jgi:hypothetical protein
MRGIVFSYEGALFSFAGRHPFGGLTYVQIEVREVKWPVTKNPDMESPN